MMTLGPLAAEWDDVCDFMEIEASHKRPSPSDAPWLLLCTPLQGLSIVLLGGRLPLIPRREDEPFWCCRHGDIPFKKTVNKVDLLGFWLSGAEVPPW